MNPKILFIPLALTLMMSCVQKKWILKNNTIATMSSDPEKKGYSATRMKLHEIKEGFSSKITQKGEFLLIESVPDISLKNPPIGNQLASSGVSGVKKDFTGKYYFPETMFKSDLKNLKYLDSKPVLQGLSIPLKIRPRLNNTMLADSFPSQTETGFNPAIAFGWKLNYNSFRHHEDIFGRKFRQYSIIPGWFVGTGATDLKKSNTRDPIIKFERKAVLISTGGFVMLGFNNFNVGYSFGWDWATGTNSSTWLYQGKLWHGVTIGLDIID